MPVVPVYDGWNFVGYRRLDEAELERVRVESRRLRRLGWACGYSALALIGFAFSLPIWGDATYHFWLAIPPFVAGSCLLIFGSPRLQRGSRLKSLSEGKEVSRFENDSGEWFELFPYYNGYYASSGARPKIPWRTRLALDDADVAAVLAQKTWPGWDDSDLAVWVARPKMASGERPTSLKFDSVQKLSRIPTPYNQTRAWLQFCAAGVIVFFAAACACRYAENIGNFAFFVVVGLGVLWMVLTTFPRGMMARARFLRQAALIGQVERYESEGQWVDLLRWTETITAASESWMYKSEVGVYIPGSEMFPHDDFDFAGDFGTTRIVRERPLTESEHAEWPWSHYKRRESKPEDDVTHAFWLLLAAYVSWQLVQKRLYPGLAFCAIPPVISLAGLRRRPEQKPPEKIEAVIVESPQSEEVYWCEQVDGEFWTVNGVPSQERVRRVREGKYAAAIEAARSKAQ